MDKVLLADDHLIVLKGLSDLLYAQYGKIEIDAISNAAQIVDKITQTKYDVIILDVDMPGFDVSEAIIQILAHDPSNKVIIFSMVSPKLFTRRLYSLGIKGFISKEASPKEILDAIDRVMLGRIYYNNDIVDILMQSKNNMGEGNPFERLSEREVDVFKLLMQGRSVKEISNNLNMQPGSVGTLKARIFNKTATKNIIELSELYRIHRAV
jgi:DNA-binding NarL/FixJ family response regulator